MAFSKTRFYAAIELPRPINCLITFASVLLGGWLGIHEITEPLIFAALSAALITAGGNALNDLCGITEDRINKPHRPLPSGRLSPGIARLQMGIFLLAGILLALPLPTPALAIALIAIASLILYNTYLKRVPLIGNLTVSALGGLAFLYGGAAVQVISAPYLIAGLCLSVSPGPRTAQRPRRQRGRPPVIRRHRTHLLGRKHRARSDHWHLCNPHHRDPIARALGHLQPDLSHSDSPPQFFAHLRPHPPLGKQRTRIFEQTPQSRDAIGPRRFSLWLRTNMGLPAKIIGR